MTIVFVKTLGNHVELQAPVQIKEAKMCLQPETFVRFDSPEAFSKDQNLSFDFLSETVSSVTCLNEATLLLTLFLPSSHPKIRIQSVVSKMSR